MSPKEFQGDSTTLCQIFVIFRHGDRAPLFIWSSDPSKSDWPNGPGSLTNNGKEQGYMIGKHLRKWYPGFLDDKYLKDEIHVHSTNSDRTLMTALCCLAGLYPPKGDDIWLADMPWQPIPINTAPMEIDPFAPVFETQDFLPSIDSVNTSKSDEFRILSDHKDILKTIVDKSKNEGHNGCLFGLLCTFDANAMRARKGLPTYWPPGIDLDLKTAHSISTPLYSLVQRSKGIMRPSAYHLQDILSKTERKIEGKIPIQKAFLYSTHDLIINNFFTLLKIPAVRAAFGATIVFELHKNPENGEYYMKVMLKDNIENAEDPKALPINGSTMIPFSEFQKIISGIKIEEEEQSA